MAVNRIRYRDGKKICIPVKNKTEYMALRDAKFNKECAEKARKGETFTTKSGEQKSYKTMLEQFNYSVTTPSCPTGILPHNGEERLAHNGEFPLKGANCVGNSVGMDIDFDEAEKGKIPEVAECILAKMGKREAGSAF